VLRIPVLKRESCYFSGRSRRVNSLVTSGFFILQVILSTSTPFQNAIEDLLIRDKQAQLLPANQREIYRVGQAAGALYYARSGMVKLSEDHGPAGITLEIVRPGETFGEESLLGFGAYRATATRLTDGEVLRIPAGLFPRIATRRQELWQGIAWLLHERLRGEQRNYRWLVRVSTEERILAMLEHLAPSCPLVPKVGTDRDWYGVPLTQAELALLVGASRETTSSVLNEMERKGALALRRGRILMPAVASRATHAG